MDTLLTNLPESHDQAIAYLRAVDPDTRARYRRQAELALAEAEVFEEAEAYSHAQQILNWLTEAESDEWAMEYKSEFIPTIKYTVNTKNSGVVSFTSTLTHQQAQARVWERHTAGERGYRTDFAIKLARNPIQSLSPTLIAWLHYLATKEPEVKSTSEWLGKVGERLELLVKVTRTFVRDGRYGQSTVISMLDSGGNLLVWFASGTPDMVVGESYAVTATVKGHETFQGQKQTVLTRIKKI